MACWKTSLSAHSKSHITAAVQIMNDRQTLCTFIKVPQMNNSFFHIQALKYSTVLHQPSPLQVTASNTSDVFAGQMSTAHSMRRLVRGPYVSVRTEI